LLCLTPSRVIVLLAVGVLATACIGPFARANPAAGTPLPPQLDPFILTRQLTINAITPLVPTLTPVPPTPTSEFTEGTSMNTACVQALLTPSRAARVQAPGLEIVFRVNSNEAFTTVVNSVDEAYCGRPTPSRDDVVELLRRISIVEGVTGLDVRSVGN
jgi:hypothetical protein